jgi:hypothetical protein
MISSVEGIGVFFLTRGTHDEALHGGLFPVIGKGFDDGVARATVSAVDKGIKVSTVCRRFHLARTVCAHGYIGRDKNETLLLHGFLDIETFESEIGSWFHLDLFDLRERRGVILNGTEKVLEVAWFVFFDMDFHTEADVFYPSFVVEVASHTIDKRTEANSLDNAENHYLNRRPFSFLH